MKLSFSTRGWRELPWAEQIRDASELRFQGIEVYNLHRVTSLTERGGAFHKFSRNETLRNLREHDLVIPCFDTCIDLSDPAEDLQPAFELTETAACIWLYAEAGQSAEKIACNMAEEFEVDIQTARRAVSAFFNLLVDRGMAIETDSC